MEYRNTVVLPEGMTWETMPPSLRAEVRDADLVLTNRADGHRVIKNRYGPEGSQASEALRKIAYAGRGTL